MRLVITGGGTGGHTSPAVAVYEELLRRAFMNIVLNACEAMATGGTVTITTSLESGGVVRISVSDTGPGIPTADLEQIFVMYYTTKPGGSGLGLPTTGKIIEAHGGTITCQSEVGRGTRFTIELPALPRLIAAEARS